MRTVRFPFQDHDQTRQLPLHSSTSFVVIAALVREHAGLVALAVLPCTRQAALMYPFLADAFPTALLCHHYDPPFCASERVEAKGVDCRPGAVRAIDVFASVACEGVEG